MTGLARVIALPSEFAPVRFPSFPALERTAVMGFNQPATLSIPANTSVKVGLARQAAWPVWADQELSGTCASISFQLQNNPASGTIDKMPLNPAPVRWTVGNAALNAYGPSVQSSNASNISYPILGVDDATGMIPWIYIPPGGRGYFTVWNVSGATTAAATNCRVWYDIWNSPGQVESQYVDFTSVAGNVGVGGVAAQALTGLWWRPTHVDSVVGAAQNFNWNAVNAMVVNGGTAAYSPSAANAGSWTVTPASNVAFYPLVQPSEFANSTLPWYSTRVTASAVLATNVTQVLNKAGTVLGGRIAPEVANMWAVTSSYINGLHPAEKAWLPLETGAYSYVPPSTDMVQFWDYTMNTSNVNIQSNNCPVYRLDNRALVNVMYLTASSAIETMAITASWHLEFRTSSALFQIALSGLPIETLHQAQLALATAGFFFDNPDHKAILQRVVNAAHSMAPVGLKVVKALHPPLGRALTKVYKVIAPGRMPSKKKGNANGKGKKSVPVPKMSPSMPTTTGEKSGFNGPRGSKGGWHPPLAWTGGRGRGTR